MRDSVVHIPQSSCIDFVTRFDEIITVGLQNRALFHGGNMCVAAGNVFNEEPLYEEY